mgnify:CR=1 FL=1
MFVGTCSDAGKSILNTAFCRIFRQDGYRPAPFKAQNMSLNSCSTPQSVRTLKKCLPPPLRRAMMRYLKPRI